MSFIASLKISLVLDRIGFVEYHFFTMMLTTTFHIFPGIDNMPTIFVDGSTKDIQPTLNLTTLQDQEALENSDY